MAVPALLQHKAAGSTTAAPASFTLSFTQNSAVGSTLVVFLVAAMSAAGSISNPGSPYTTLYNNGGSAIQLAVYAAVNNPGGLGNVSFNLTNVNGIVGAVLEYPGIQQVDIPFNTSTATFTNTASTTVIPESGTPTYSDELFVGFIGSLTGATLTSNTLPAGFFTTQDTASSTTGATNATITTFTGYNGVKFPQSPITIAGSLSVAEPNGCGLVGLLMPVSRAIRGANVGGIHGYVDTYVGGIGG